MKDTAVRSSLEHHNVATASEIPQNSGAKGMIPLIEDKQISLGNSNIDSVFTNEGMGGLFGELNNEGGALGQSITGQIEKSLGHHVTTQPNGDTGISLENMAKAELSQPVPNVSSDIQLKHLSARGGGASQSG
jgi:hypothetical protein